MADDMYNYGRTLLLNIAGNDSYFGNIPGDELIPSEYVPAILSTYLRNVRNILFGANPDRAMLNYRAAQLLGMISSTELQQYVEELDSRITYSSYQIQLAQPSTFQPAVTQYGESDASKILTVIGGPSSPDASGISGYDYRVTVDGVNIIIDKLFSPTSSTQEVLSFTAGLSDAYPLAGTDYSVRVNTSTLDGGWTVRGFLRPTRTLDALEEELRSLGEPDFLQLFGVTSVEPYQTFKNCWNNHPDFAYRLGGLVLATIYRTGELTNA
tara:strand:+ start:11781 stop:12584 length:804 start_codon:yes stop_codon:yes gene_type:complete